MPLIESHALLRRFAELLKNSTQVDIAVAWAGPGRAVDTLLKHAESTRIRIAVGLSGNATEPKTLRHLMAHDNVELRVAPSPRGGIFHPKFYRFRFRGRQPAVCWIGSANFTRGGFGGNAELVNEFSDRNDEGEAWFEDFWQRLVADPGPAIAHYEEHYRPYRPLFAPDEGNGHVPDLPWNDFVTALRDLDGYCHYHEFGWSVLGETYSYLHTIGAGRDVALHGNWRDPAKRDSEPLMDRDRDILLGFGHPGKWDLLGRLRPPSGNAFTPPVDHEVLDHVLQQIDDVANAKDDDVPEVAQQAVAGIRELKNFGPAAATRILTLARPDRLVSVNGQSAPGLGVFAGLSRNEDSLARRYNKLLAELYKTQWFNAPEPDDALERKIWHCRAALVDAFLYIPNYNPNHE